MGAVGHSISSSIDAQTHNNVIEDVIPYVKPGQVRSVADHLAVCSCLKNTFRHGNTYAYYRIVVAKYRYIHKMIGHRPGYIDLELSQR